MTGKCLLAACLLLSIVSALTAEQNAASDRVQNQSLPKVPSIQRTIVPLPFPAAIHGSTGTIPPDIRWEIARLSSPTELRSLVRPAGIIFSGQVIAVQRDGDGAAEGAAAISSATNITFRVVDAFRGTIPGENLTIHEWAGLWTRGETYRVGERVLLFLYPPSRLGFTSPVHSAVGRFEMIMRDTIALNPWQTQFFSRGMGWRTRARIPYAALASYIRRAMGETGETIRSGAR